MGCSRDIRLTMLAVCFVLIWTDITYCVNTASTAFPPPGVDDADKGQADNQTSSVQDPTDLHSLLLCDRGTCKNRCREAYTVDRGQFLKRDASAADKLKRTHFSQENASVASDICQCDDLCVIFGDCCYDYFLLCHNINISSLLANLTGPADVNEFVRKTVHNHSHFNQKVSMFQLKNCKAFSFHEIEGSYWVIESCPDDFNDKITAHKCKNTHHPNPLSSIPVSFRSVPGIVFRNVFCGICHGLPKKDLIPWSSYVSCTNDTTPTDYDDLVFRLSADYCTINVKPSSQSLFRRCFDYDRLEEPARVDLCAESFLSKSYAYKVYLGTRAHRNPHSLPKTAIHSSHLNHLSCHDHDTDYHGIQMPQCGSKSCEGFCGTVDRSDCQCDPHCVLYGDCCYDFTWFCLKHDISLWNLVHNATALHMLLETDQMLNRSVARLADDELREYPHWMAKFFHYRSCVNIYFCVRETKSYWMISTCPKTHLKDQTSLLCEYSNPNVTESLIPVYHKNYSDVIFRNMYCGQCHGLTNNDLVPVNVSVTCPIKEPYSHLTKPLQNGKCQLCCSDNIKGRQCLETDLSLKESMEYWVSDNCLSSENVTFYRNWCTLYRYELLAGNEAVRNPHCGILKGEKMYCIENKSGFNNRAASNGNQRGGLGILFNVNDKGMTFQTKKPCDTNEVYDDINKICKRLVCLHGMVAVDGKCLPNGTWFAEEDNFLLPNGFSRFIISIHFKVKENLTSDLESFQSNLTKLMRENIQSEIFRLNKSLSVQQIDIFMNPDAKINNSGNLSSIMELTFANDANLTVTIKTLSLINELINDQTLRHGFKSNQAVLSNYGDSKNLFCHYGEMVSLMNVTLVSLESGDYANKSDRLYPLKNTAFTLTFQNGTPLLDEIMICDIPLDCDTVIYNVSHFRKKGGSLISITKNLLLPNGTYYISGSGVFACHNFTRLIPLFFNFDNIQAILTYVMSGISMVCLIVTVCVHALLPDLKNLPGRLIMSLSVSMVLAQGLLLFIHLVSGILCQVLAVTLHFSWLCSFTWMTAVSINLAHTFTCQSKTSTDQQIAKTHLKFILFASGFPLMIVAPSVMVDLMDIPELFIGYGAFGVCWIANPLANLLLFVVPVAAMLLVNTAAFILTFYNIEKNMRVSKNIISTKKDTSKCFIYGKLFVIMGLSWSSSFVAVFTDINIVWYIFIILNGLQGLYIFVSFVCTNRVKGMLMKRFTGLDSTFSTSATKDN